MGWKVRERGWGGGGGGVDGTFWDGSATLLDRSAKLWDGKVHMKSEHRSFFPGLL